MQIGTLVIDHLVATMTKKELQQAGDTCKQVDLSTVISNRNTMTGLNIPKYDLKGVKGKTHTIREVVIPSFVTTVVKGIANLMTHSKCMNAVAEPVIEYLDHVAMARSYGVLKPGRDKIEVCLRNHSAKQNPPPTVDCCGRYHSSKHHPDSVGTKANRG